ALRHLDAQGGQLPLRVALPELDSLLARRRGHRNEMVPAGIPQVACRLLPREMDETEETVADKYPFLSEEWIAEVRKLGDEARADGGGAKIPHAVKMNQVITDVPFGDGTVNVHMDTTSGDMQMEMGHIENPDLTVTVDYATAKAIFVDGNPQAGMQAFMAGKVKVQGDMTKLMAMQAAPPDPKAQEFAQKVKEMTAE